uniref:Uncharacterized protein n=1 Tax=Anguilla anguilla TaxID=7936 RepID=A0A0E9S104_ANGAN
MAQDFFFRKTCSPTAPATKYFCSALYIFFCFHF